MKSPLRQLAYRSRACILEHSTDCLDILRVALRRNETLGITGCLHLQNGMFLQMVEGPAPSIETLMQSILRDSRHIDVQTLLDRPGNQRFFPDWHMCLASSLTRPNGSGLGPLPDPEEIGSMEQAFNFFTGVYALKTGAQFNHRPETCPSAQSY